MERLVELAFLAELTQEAWFGRNALIDVMHSSVDSFGHDVVLECGSALRHVQLKTRQLNGTTRSYGINTRLAERPSGCVVWIGYQQVTGTRRISMQYRWFGNPPGQPLPPLGDHPVKHTKANSEGIKAVRPGLRSIRLSQFEPVSSAAELLDRLFGTG